MPISAVDSINTAFEHTKQQLFQPFRFGQWARLAFVGLLAGELASGGGCNFRVPSFNPPRHRAFPAMPHWDPALLVPLIIVAVIVIPVLWFLFMYISSRMRFVLFDSVVEKRCEIGRMWGNRSRPALQYFLWQIAYAIVTLMGFAILVGIPVLLAFLSGWFKNAHDHIAGLILGGLAVFTLFFCWMVLTLVVHVFTKDFVVPLMALEGVSAFEGWRRLLPMLNAERLRYAGYAGMKIMLAIGAGIVVGIAAIIVIILLLIPIGGIGIISVVLAKGAGLGWSAGTITLAIVAGCILIALLMYVMALISVPVIVFFPAYSIHFFAARYPLLAALIYPPPPAPPMPETPPEPPLMPPLEPLPGPAI